MKRDDSSGYGVVGVAVGSLSERVEAGEIRQELERLSGRLRREAGTFTHPKAQALFETGAEVLDGLCKAFDHYETGSESAMREPEPLPERPPDRESL